MARITDWAAARAKIEGALAARGYRLIHLGAHQGHILELHVAPERGQPRWDYAGAFHLDHRGPTGAGTLDEALAAIRLLPDLARPGGVPVGTRSLLVGAHQFLLHPLAVLVAWVRLHGWPRQWQVLVAIALHDLGYWGCRTMDGPDGARHPHRGAWLVHRLCDRPTADDPYEWYYFAACHSRTYARYLQHPPSPLAQPDKLGTRLLPRPLYVAQVALTGEWREYRDRWVASGHYPGHPDDGVWAWSGHLWANWDRFKAQGALVGSSYGGE